MRRMYSEKQLENIVDEHLEDSDVKVKTIEQSEPNWAYDVTSFPTVSGCTASVTFCRIQRINGELHIIMQGKVHNDTESDISVYGLNGIYLTLPEDIASKLYDVKGDPASESVPTEVRITTASCQVYRNGETGLNSSNLTDRCLLMIANTSNANRIFINFGGPVAITLVAGKDTYFEGRIFLDLI